MSTFLEVFGDGSDGAFNNGTLTKGQEYNFTDFVLSQAIVLGAGDGNKIIVRCTGDLEVTSAGKITSTADGSSKDTSTETIDGVPYSCESTDGAGGAIGIGGVNAPYVTCPPGGDGGIMGIDGEDGGDGRGVSAPLPGGAGGTAPGGDGADGVDMYTRDQSKGSGGGGGAGGAPLYQNGIIFLVAGTITIDGEIIGNGGTSSAGGDGGQGGDMGCGINSATGCGGGGGAGGGGGGGVNVKMISLAVAGISGVTMTAAAGGGGAGGSGGIAGADVCGSSYPPLVGNPGTAGTVGSSGTAGAITASVVIVTPLVDSENFVPHDDAMNLSAAISNTGGANATERGFVWIAGSSGDPTTANNKVSEVGDFGTGPFTGEVTGLTIESDYRVRAFATNSKGTTYTDTQTVTTTRAEFVPQPIMIT